MRFRSSAIVLSCLLAGGQASAGSVDFNLSDDAFRLGGAQDITETGLELEGSWLHEQDSGDLLDVGLHLIDDANPGRGALDIGVGGKLVYIDFDDADSDGAAFAIGGKFRYTWATFNRFAVGGHLYHAPSVTSGGDIDDYTEAALRAEYLVLRNANAYIGVRNVRVGLDSGGTETFESGLHLGVRLDF